MFGIAKKKRKERKRQIVVCFDAVTPIDLHEKQNKQIDCTMRRDGRRELYTMKAFSDLSSTTNTMQLNTLCECLLKQMLILKYGLNSAQPLAEDIMKYKH